MTGELDRRENNPSLYIKIGADRGHKRKWATPFVIRPTDLQVSVDKSFQATLHDVHFPVSMSAYSYK